MTAMGAFDDYQAPTQRQGGAFSDYKPPSSAAAPPLPPVAAATPAGAGMWSENQGNFVLNHLAQVGNLINNAGRAIDDYTTYGFGDAVRSKMPGAPTLDTLRAQTTGAHQALGPVADTILGIGTAGVGGVSGLPAMAADAARAAAGGSRLAGWGAGALAAGGQGAGTAALGTIGHGGSMEDAEQAAKVGGGLGLALGTLGVGSAKSFDPRAPSAVLPSDQTIAELAARKTATYAPNDRVLFNQNEVAPRLQAVRNAVPSNQEWRLAKSTRAKVEGLIDDPQHTATSIEDARDWLNKLANNPMASPEDRQFAPGFANALDDVLKTGISPTAPTGFAAQVRDAGDVANQQLQNAKMVQGWRDAAALPRSGGIGKGAPASALAELKANPNFYTNPDVNQAMRGVAGAGSWLPGSWLMHHAIAYPALGAIVGAAHGYGSAGAGENPWERAAIEGLGLAGAVGAAGGVERGVANVLTRRAIARAVPTLTAGAPYAPTTPLRDALQALLMSQGAKGTGY